MTHIDRFAPPFTARLARVRARLIDAGMEAFVVTELHNIRYLTGFNGSAGLLIVTSAGEAPSPATSVP